MVKSVNFLTLKEDAESDVTKRRKPKNKIGGTNCVEGRRYRGGRRYRRSVTKRDVQGEINQRLCDNGIYLGEASHELHQDNSGRLGKDRNEPL